MGFAVKGDEICRERSTAASLSVGISPNRARPAVCAASRVPERVAVASAISADSHKRRAKVMGFCPTSPYRVPSAALRHPISGNKH